MQKITVRYQFLALTLIPLGLFIYSDALRAPFVYDDRGYIVTNAAIRSLSNFLDLSGTRYVGFLSFALNYKAGGLTPFDFHLTNVLIHSVNAVLVFFLVMAVYETPLIRGMTKGEDGAGKAFISMALVSSAVFLAHPVETQAVTYITQRFASLATMFYLLSVFLYSKAMVSADTGAGNRRKWLFYAGSLVSTAIAMKTKEISFTIPFTIALYDYLFFPESFGKRAPLRIPFYLTFLIIPLSVLGPEIGLSPNNGISEDLRKMELHDAGTVSRYTYLLTQISVIATYIRLLVFPADQRVDYDYPLSSSVLEARTFSCLVFLLALILSAVFIWRISMKRKNFYGAAFSFGISWFFITLMVESSVVPIQDVIFEHRAYLPSVGFMISSASAAFFCVDRLRSKLSLRVSDALAAILILAAVFPPLSYALHRRNLIWTDEMALINNAIERSPGKARLYYARGLVHLDRKEFEPAIADATRAISLNPRIQSQYNLRGIAYSAVGKYRESLKDLTLAIAYDPTVAAPYYNRAITYAVLGDYRRAIEDYNIAILIDPDYAEAYNNRGVVYSALGDANRAASDLRKACAKGHPEGCRNLIKLVKG